MVVLLKTTSVRVSFILIMQIRVQNKRKSIRKSRYDGDVSTPPKFKPLLVLKQFSWQTFTNSFALVLDSNLHHLNETNPDWRCFQQNYHGVFLCRNKSSRKEMNLFGDLFYNKKILEPRTLGGGPWVSTTHATAKWATIFRAAAHITTMRPMLTNAAAIQ